MTRLRYQQFRNGNIIEKVSVTTVSTSNGKSSCYVGLQDIQDVFPDALRFNLDGCPIPFLVDSNHNRIEPLRIAFYLGKTLDVVTEVPQPSSSCSSSDSDVIAHLLASTESENLALQDPLLPLSSVVRPFNSALTAGNNIQTADDVNSNLKEMKSQATKEKDEKLIESQLEATEEDEMISSSQHQALDKLAILQKHAQAILIHNLELHEYSTPRLFLVLPVNSAKWDPTNVLKNELRLYFPCECEDHSVEASKCSQNGIHTTEHGGYEIRNITEFFKKYGKYMAILLRWFKLGMGTSLSASMAPVLNLLDAGIDYSLAYMKALSAEYPALNNFNAIDDNEALVEADPQQLGTFLQISVGDRQLGDLYRTTTERGHVKWVCGKHYRSTYTEEEQKAFEDIVVINGGKYDSQLGKVVIKLGSRVGAKEFFDALAKAKHVYEVNITYDSELSNNFLRELEGALRVSNVSALQLDLGLSQESNKGKPLSTSTRYEVLARIIRLGSMKTIHIVLPRYLIQLSDLPTRRPSHLHKLSFEITPIKIYPNDFQIFVKSLKNNTTLTYLDLRSNAVKEIGALALSEALKSETTLKHLTLSGNQIGNEGALALSEALKSNTSLTTLNLEHNRIGEEGALALSIMLKVNMTLTALRLRNNSIWDIGARDLSDALKANTALTTLDLNQCYIGDEGALALSEALKVNTTLTTLDLECNLIGEEGTLALSEVRRANRTLAALRPGSGSIEDIGALRISKTLPEALKSSTALTTLRLKGHTILNEEALVLSKALKANTNITILNLSYNTFSSGGLFVLSEALKTNTNLTTLNLTNSSIGEGEVLILSQVLKTNVTLANLDLSYNKIMSRGVLTLSKALKVNTALTTLSLRCNSIWKEGAMALSEALKTNTSLTNLDLQGNLIRGEGALALSEALKTNTTLTALRLGHNAIGARGALKLSEMLRINTTLTVLDLKGNAIREDGARALSEALKANKALTTLTLIGTSIGEEAVIASPETLKTNTSLTALNLTYNYIGDGGALALSEMLKANTTLANLNLMSNLIKEEGILVLLEALKANTTLTALTLGGNLIGIKGGLALAEMLKTNSALTTLNLWRTSFGDGEALAVSEALKTNMTLATLDLGNNSIGKEGALALAEALKVNTALTTLNLSGGSMGVYNVIGEEGSLALSEALMANTALTLRLE
ncbi:hypothetical protein BCR41DRAFT_348998 [Lobosporangium transversale]|uniref:RNI-like protein n=1 Tax=Lobosporangium transversale TaxID=64571 RepID=A0A1Y2GY41_9FUNG|nr:hypothetical protein BCR41DRAFT_348998 [Lobosporangium transversale]ORZ23693.1 hypothetical protein BCR41DRAFT_348998 [Lobosporangium transversale]|eukprot:XP_021883507.1 hypothetical protein BCR41DRAFT_348998 [Lobosporangium transversale]